MRVQQAKGGFKYFGFSVWEGGMQGRCREQQDPVLSDPNNGVAAPGKGMVPTQGPRSSSDP